MFLIWLRVATALYGLASLAALPAVLYGRPRWNKVCLGAAIGGFFFHFVSLMEMMNAAHHWVPTGMHEVQSMLALLIMLAFLLIALLYRTVTFGMFALPLVFLLVLIPAIGPDKYTFTSPLIRNGWVFVHIAAVLAAYAGLIFSLVASLLYLLQERRIKSKRKQKAEFLPWLPPLETIDQIAHRTLLVGFHAMTIGLLAGSLIAQASMGSAYFRDPKVLLSFGMWLLFVVLLFIRRSKGLRGRRAVYLSSLVFLVMLSVWAANQVSSFHRFTTP
ncbi:MAG TPA: cytochrome c biogenesis protein CcsA [Acidisarcina sp.]|nr:cytochrome c biogenesis protein CcsA [Acidisarcina sp.]